VSKDLSNLAKGGIAKSSFVVARWQHRTDGLGAIAMHVLVGGSTPESPLLSPTRRVHAEWHLNRPDSLQAGCTNVTDDRQTDRQTDHATENYFA